MGRVRQLSPIAACSVPALLSVGLATFGFLDTVRQNTQLQLSFLGPASLLLAWSGVVWKRACDREGGLRLGFACRPQHYVQAITQATFLGYWGWYWSPLYESTFLIGAQLAFAYAFDMLLGWTRRRVYTLGFGPVPVVLSINLFLWFADDWFYLQFLLVALGFAAKEFILWEKDGRQTHVFNPSSFPLAVFSVALILTGTSDLTWGQDIATTQFYPPHVYVVLFFIALPGQLLFGVTTMTMSAVATTYLFSLVYFASTGVYFFYDAHIPIAVFLGMHLLFTDPSTAPRTELGRLMFGVLYGISTVGLYAGLSGAGIPPFYDKLLQVPILNLSIRRLDQLAARVEAPRRTESGGEPGWQGAVRKYIGYVRPRRNVVQAGFSAARMQPGFRHGLLARVSGVDGQGLARSRWRLASIGAWAVFFAIMMVTQGVGDRHPGQWVPFWQQACDEERPGACRYVEDMQLRLCDNGAGWSCNEAAVMRVGQTARMENESGGIATAAAARLFERGCQRGFQPACANRTRLGASLTLARATPTLDDYPIILRGSKGPVTDQTPAALYAMACGQGWAEACDRDPREPSDAR